MTVVQVDPPIHLEFPNNALLPLLYGERDAHLRRVEQSLGVSIVSRGNHLVITGEPSATGAARTAIEALYQRLEKGMAVEAGEVDAAIRLGIEAAPAAASPCGRTNSPSGPGSGRSRRARPPRRPTSGRCAPIPWSSAWAPRVPARPIWRWPAPSTD